MTTLPDDDPADNMNCLDPGRATNSAPSLKQGRDTPNTETFNSDNYDEEFCSDDANCDEEFCLDEDDKPLACQINAISIHNPPVLEPYEILSASSDDDISDCSSVSGDSVFQIGDGPSDVDNDPGALRAQIDSGAFASVTDQLHMLHDYKEFNAEFPCPIRLSPAKRNSTIVPEGVGYLHVPAINAYGHIAVRTFYSPALRTTVIDERDFLRFGGTKPEDFMGERIEKYCDAGTFTFHATHRRRKCQDVYVHGILRHGKCYTGALIPPNLDADHPKATPFTSSAVARSTDPDFEAACQRATVQAVYAHQEEQYAILRKDLESLPMSFRNLPFHEYIQQNTPVASIQAETERLLWHQRLGHPSDYYLYNAHKHVKGVPQFVHEHPILDKCPTCIQAKQTKEHAGHDTTRTATVPYQGLSIDFSFAGVASKNQDREADFVGLNGEKAWILVADHFSRRLHGDTRISKGTPIEWLRRFLTNHSPKIPDKYIFVDQGGELYHNPEFVELCHEFQYVVRPTGADASNQNGPVERAHLTLANAVRAMLHGANLPIKFWPYAFHHYLRIKNSLPSRLQDLSPTEMATGKQDDFSGFRTFGCRVWVRPPGRRSAKFRVVSRKGIFLGFLPNTTTNILWYDEGTGRVKIAKHARFDEGMNDLPFDSIPPNVQHLTRVRHGNPIEAESGESSVDEFVFSANPFSHTLSPKLVVKERDSSFGFIFATDKLYNRAYISDIKKKSDAERLFSTPQSTRNKIRGAYVVSIGGERVFTEADCIRVLQQLFDESASEFEIEFAPERKLGANDLRKALLEHDHDLFVPDERYENDDQVPTLSINDLRVISRHLFPDTDFSSDSVSDADIAFCINALQSKGMTSEEEALGTFTRRKLKTLSTWPEWQAGEFKQLDRFHALRMYGDPVPRPSDPDAIVLRPLWQYKVKSNGKRRSRNCCDGSPRAAPALHGIASTYSSCVEQPIQRLFFALSADATDAYAHSPPPQVPTYVSIDDAYAEWYESRFGIKIDRSYVLPVLHALQGHPESGRLWEEHINRILKSPELGFEHTTHDRTIYSATFEGHRVLLLRQVDDFALACEHEETAKRIYDIIGARLQMEHETEPPFEYYGLLTEYNGVDITQSRDAITISCPRYIQRVLKSHMWEADSKDPPDAKCVPMTADSLTQLYSEVGPAEGTPEYKTLSDKMGFSYRTVLGELLYAYITCRPDIGYAVVTLSKFASSPAQFHYTALKNVVRYLRRTMHWGIVYRKSTPDPSMPTSAAPNLVLPGDLPEVVSRPGHHPYRKLVLCHEDFVPVPART